MVKLPSENRGFALFGALADRCAERRKGIVQILKPIKVTTTLVGCLIMACSPVRQATPGAGATQAPSSAVPAGASTPVGACSRLEGVIGASAQWGSGWLDLNARPRLSSGAKLRIAIGGTARKILVRVLREGESADNPTGVLGSYEVPKDRIVVATTTRPFENVKQISVHGGKKAWDWPLGDDNDPATLFFVEYCP
jgi:hypothetical protein